VQAEQLLAGIVDSRAICQATLNGAKRDLKNDLHHAST
jgi:hypothetical protein